MLKEKEKNVIITTMQYIDINNLKSTNSTRLPSHLSRVHNHFRMNKMLAISKIKISFVEINFMI